jgi:hypothetical protein
MTYAEYLIIKEKCEKGLPVPYNDYMAYNAYKKATIDLVVKSTEPVYRCSARPAGIVSL